MSVRHPSRTVVAAVLKLVEAERAGVGVTLTLRESSALLRHLQAALAAAAKGPRR